MAFQSCPEQHGLMVTIGSEIVGLEILPDERTYKVLHQKLLARYAAMTLVNARLFRDGAFQDKAMAFFRAIAECHETKCGSACSGTDLRLEAPSVSGQALLLGEQVVHLCFLTCPQNSWELSQCRALENRSNLFGPEKGTIMEYIDV